MPAGEARGHNFGRGAGEASIHDKRRIDTSKNSEPQCYVLGQGDKFLVINSRTEGWTDRS